MCGGVVVTAVGLVMENVYAWGKNQKQMTSSCPLQVHYLTECSKRNADRDRLMTEKCCLSARRTETKQWTQEIKRRMECGRN